MPAVGSDVWVERRKWPEAPHYGTTGTVLGENEHGVWVGARAGSRIRMPDGSERRGEDEFEQHRVSLAYPEDLVVNARRADTEVLARVHAGEPPFTLESAAPWLERLTSNA